MMISESWGKRRPSRRSASGTRTPRLRAFSISPAAVARETSRAPLAASRARNSSAAARAAVCRHTTTQATARNPASQRENQ